jgi:hypothetical protein
MQRTMVTRSLSRLEGSIDTATLRAVTKDLRRATRGSYEVLGLLAVRGRRSLVFLASRDLDKKFVGLRLESSGQVAADSEEFALRAQALSEVLPEPPKASCAACHTRGAPTLTTCRGCGAELDAKITNFATIPLTPELELTYAQNAVGARFSLLGKLSAKYPDWFLATPARTECIAALRFKRTPTPGKREAFSYSLVAEHIFAADVVAPPAQSAPAAPRKICPSCKRRFEPDSRFCSRDGSRLVVEGQ